MKSYLFLIFLFLLSCSPAKEENNTEAKKSAYVYIDKKTEDQDEMMLYEIGDSVNTDSLILFCKSKKQNFKDGAFHILVFFNKKENARFPDNPLSAMYMESRDLKNIKADYTYNNINGYSQLTIYGSKITTVDIK